jgi:hypothetical protein
MRKWAPCSMHLRTINQTTDEPRSQTILNGKVSSRETACTAASTPSTVLLTPFSRRLHGPPRHLRRLQSCSPHSAGAYMVHRGIYAVYSPAHPIQQALTWSTAHQYSPPAHDASNAKCGTSCRCCSALCSPAASTGATPLLLAALAAFRSVTACDAPAGGALCARSC